jgi:uncharacterized protein
VLLTDPGERVNLPQFGAGLRRRLFAPMTSSLGATTKLTVTQALAQWIPTQIVVQDVTVTTSVDDPGIQDGAIIVTVSYQLVETRTPRQTVLTVS